MCVRVCMCARARLMDFFYNSIITLCFNSEGKKENQIAILYSYISTGGGGGGNRDVDDGNDKVRATESKN